ncbi:TerC family protein [Pelomicrobium sp.]|uniref:TerC family protein n=1 Tax=Pelomicrobium sp. TaxID=2815319 RepID=UPI002FDC9940
MPETIGTAWMWAAFAIFVVAALVADIVLLERGGARRITLREAAWWSALWVVLSFAFAGLLWWYLDIEHGRSLANLKVTEFLTGYLVEKSLAVDNIFVFLMLFSYFAVPLKYQRRVLIYGIVGAIVLRAAMILGGAWLIARFHWVLYLFGAFLLATGIKMWVFADAKPDLERNPVLRWLRGHLRITPEFHQERFFIIRDGKWWATPLFVVMVMVGVTDVVFAVDSIPAIFAITLDPFIVLTSNVFAILGLRAMYFLLAGFAGRFHLLSYGLALILMFIGVKMLIADFYKIPVFVSLAVVVAILAASVALSMVLRPGLQGRGQSADAES